MSEHYEPEIGQFTFGCAWQQFGCPDSCNDALMALTEALPSDGASPCYGAWHENDVFVMRRYNWDGCSCGFEEAEWEFSQRDPKPTAEECDAWLKEHWHLDDCLDVLPNFHHKPTGLKISWYKYIGRGMSSNQKIKYQEFAAIIAQCIASLERAK